MFTSKLTDEVGIGGSLGIGTLKLNDIGDATGFFDGEFVCELVGRVVGVLVGEFVGAVVGLAVKIYRSIPPIGGFGTPNSGSQHNIFAEQLSTK